MSRFFFDHFEAGPAHAAHQFGGGRSAFGKYMLYSAGPERLFGDHSEIIQNARGNGFVRHYDARVYTETGVDPQFGPVVGNNPISK